MKRIIAMTLLIVCISIVFVSCGMSVESSDGGKLYYSSEDNSLLLKSEASETISTDQKLIKACSIVAETKEYDSAVNAITAAITEAGGYVESQSAYGNSYGYSGKRHLSMTIRIPVTNLDVFTNQMNGLLNVVSISSSVENVTDSYYDTEARLNTLKVEHASLLKMMESLNTSKDYEFWSQLFKEISSLEQSIASLETTIRNYDKRIAYSSVSLALSEVKELTDTEEQSFGDRIREAFVSSWEDFGEGWEDFTVWFIGAIPTLLVLCVVFGGIFCAIFFPIKHSLKKKKHNGN